MQETAGEVEKGLERQRKSSGGVVGTPASSLLTRISVTRVMLSALCTLNKRGWLLMDFKWE